MIVKTAAKIAAIAVLATAAITVWSAQDASAGDPCCEHKKDHTIRVPGFQLRGPNITISSTNTKLNKGSNSFQGGSGLLLQGQVQGQTFLSGGGGGFSVGGPVPTIIDNFLIEGELETKTITEQIEVPYSQTITKSRWMENVYVLQAVCMDSSNTPHPASRPDPSDQVDPNYSGELFRCMAGTWMQVALGLYENGAGQFNNGTTIACAKGEALWHQPGGHVSCAPQSPRRNCNERSLLRKFGAGIKVVRISREEQYTEQITKTRIETRTRQVTATSSNGSVKRTLVLSGGVGGG